jgi:hypothetical protein
VGDEVIPHGLKYFKSRGKVILTAFLFGCNASEERYGDFRRKVRKVEEAAFFFGGQTSTGEVHHVQAS